MSSFIERLQVHFYCRILEASGNWESIVLVTWGYEKKDLRMCGDFCWVILMEVAWSRML